MLQRAASNAYSWWWASHIRTKQSKWLDNNLQDMEDKVKSMLRLIEEDADTFAKKAEMYFKRRPELINFVQESYKSYRALAERYDHISGELQKANNAIATVFPDQVQFGMDDDDDDMNSPKTTTTTAIDISKFQKSSPRSRLLEANKDIKSPTTKTKLKLNKAGSETNTEKAPEQINKLHKEILVLQTEKEFLKSSYEIGLAKYWDIENKISNLQEKICSLQDNYSGDAVIEDDEARAVMAVAALKSCEDALVKLHEQQKKTIEESRVESQRMKNAKEKLRALRKEYGQPEPDAHISSEDAAKLNSTNESLEEEVSGLNQERLELQYVCEKVRKTFEMNSEMSVLDLAEKIDELVGKVVAMETTVSSQTAQIQRLRLENDELQSSLHSLEEEKSTLVHNTKNLCDKLKHAEEELHKIQDLDKCITDENSKLQRSFSEVCGTFNDLSDKLQSPEQQDETDRSGSQKEEGTINKREPEMVQVGEENSVSLGDEKVRKTLEEEIFKSLADASADSTSNKLEEGCSSKQETFLVDAADHEVALIQNIGVERPKESKSDDQENSTKPLEEEGEVATNNSSHQTKNSTESVVPENEHGYNNLSEESIDDQDDMALPDWQQLFLSGLEDREKILLAEYTSILRNFKDTKRKLTEAEKKNQDNLFETMSQVRDLRSVIVMRDEEINSLKQKLNFLESSLAQQGDDHVVGIESSEHHRTTSTENEETSTASNDNVIGKPKHRRVQWGMTTDANPEESDAKSLHLQSDDLPQIDEPTATTATEEKFRREIDELLEENLQFWMRFSSAFQQVQKYKVEVREIQLELQKLRDNRRQEGSSSSRGEPSVKPEVTAYYKQLKDMQTDLSAWIEQNAHLKEELQRRFSSLCNIKEEISKALEDNKGSQELQFSPYQASKFQGEVLNMLQENNKVADELQSVLESVKGVQVEVHMTLAKLTENFELSGSKGHYYNFRNFSSRTRIPLRSFIFGAKTKKPSLFACMNPALQKQYSDLRAGLPP